MGVVFFCSGCGARFEVVPGLAGRQARCKKCGQVTRIPAAGAAEKPQAASGTAARGGAALAAAGAPATDWLQAVVASQVQLKPLSVASMPAMGRQEAATPLDDATFSGLYKVRSMPSLPAVAASRGRPAGVATQVWRGQIGGIQGVLRWINDSAYLLSVPFLVLLIFGAIVKNGPMATLSATVVVLLNIGRLASGLFNLAMIPMKDGPLKGLLFLVPPIGLGMMANDWKRYRKPAKRVIEPALTLGAVALAFAFVPWLRGGEAASGDVATQLKEGMRTLESGIREKAETLPGDLENLSTKAAGMLEGARGGGASGGESGATGGGPGR
jgi:hypothetical protein